MLPFRGAQGHVPLQVQTNGSLFRRLEFLVYPGVKAVFDSRPPPKLHDPFAFSRLVIIMKAKDSPTFLW
jgi:hypothetical protein